MKSFIKYKFIISAAVLLVVFAYGCSHSFLDKQPLGALQPSSLSNTTGVRSLLIGAYSMLDGEGGATVGNQFGTGPDNWVFGEVVADNSYKGSTPSDQGDIVPLETWSVATAANSYVETKWQALYDGVQRANDVIRAIPKAADMTPANHSELMGEARFLRGFFHLEAKKIWGNVPYIGDTVTYVKGNYNQANTADIWPMIEADFKFAMDSLAVTQSEKGRVNKWAAQAFLAKTYMYELKFDLAKALLDDLLLNGVNTSGSKYGFNLAGYSNNFNPDPSAKNGPETVFAVQMSVNDGSGTNGNYGQVLNFPNDGSGPGGCCGFDNPSINLANAYKTDATTGLPLFDTYNNNPSADSATHYPGTLDPRIDFVMGRPGISYLDFGPHPGGLWVRDGTDGYFSPKKNVYALSQKKTLASNETSFWGPTQIVATNINIIRYSDLLLWAAECEIEVAGGDITKALGYVNAVRNRVATHPETWVYKTTNATFDPATYTYKQIANAPVMTLSDNYKISPYASFPDKAYAMKAIRWERRLELAEEGHRFFDLQRWDRDPNYPMDMSAVLNDYATVEKTRASIFKVNPSATFHKGVNELYPIPQNEIDLENAKGPKILIQNKGY